MEKQNGPSVGCVQCETKSDRWKILVVDGPGAQKPGRKRQWYF